MKTIIMWPFIIMLFLLFSFWYMHGNVRTIEDKYKIGNEFIWPADLTFPDNSTIYIGDRNDIYCITLKSKDNISNKYVISYKSQPKTDQFSFFTITVRNSDNKIIDSKNNIYWW